MTASEDDWLVTIKMRVRVTDRDRLLQDLHKRDPRVVDVLAEEPGLALSLAVQESVRPPDVSGVPGLAPPGSGLHASVKAEPWPSDDPL